MRCAEIRAMLPAYAGNKELPLNVRRHLARCRDCRAELGGYEDLTAALGSLATPAITPPPGLRAALVAIPSDTTRLDTVRAHVSRNRKTYAGLVVTAAGAAGAALWRNRRQRVATA